MDKDVLRILMAINSNLLSIATSLKKIETDIEVSVLWANEREEDDNVNDDLYD